MRSLALLQQPWIMDPSAFPEVEAMAMFGGPTEAAREHWTPDRLIMRVGGVAVVAITGPLMKWVPSWYNAPSLQDYEAALEATRRDDTVASVLLLIDSPGGTVAGTFAVCDAVARLAQEKPVIAHAWDLCASASYAIASQARLISVNASATVGSLSTAQVLYDVTKFEDEIGLKTVPIVSSGGEAKLHGYPGMPVDEATRTDARRFLDEKNTVFKETVQRGRRFNDAKVDAVFDGRVHSGWSAVTLGLADVVESHQQSLARLTGQAPRPPQPGRAAA